MRRTFLVFALIGIVISTVFAAANSFDAQGIGPASYSASVPIATPTPASLALQHKVDLDIEQIRGQARVIVEVPLPEGFVVPIVDADVRQAQYEFDRSLESLHLCAGEQPCRDGIFTSDSTYEDKDGDELADAVILRFEAPQVASLLPKVEQEDATAPEESPESNGIERDRAISETLPFSISGIIRGWPTGLRWPHSSITAYPRR